MATIQTARGAKETSSLGRVLMHEHVFVLSPEIMQNYPEEWGDEDTRVNDAIERLSELKAAGIDTILDPTAIGLGRYIPRIATIANQIDLNIIVATGMYTFDILPYYFRRRTPGSGPGAATPWWRCSSATSSKASPIRASRRAS
jgi:phosphotriesterase-related protein